MAEKRRCKAKTNSGSRCQNYAQEGSDYCWIESHGHPLEGNQFAIGNSGRGKTWATPEELQEDIDAYFEECDTNTRVMFVKSMQQKVEVPWPTPYTIEGLCEHLECDRRTLINYEKQEGYEEFFHTIKKAKNKIQRDKVERGLSGQSNSTVTIFDLKNNHGYKDEQDHNLRSPDGSMTPKTIERRIIKPDDE